MTAESCRLILERSKLDMSSSSKITISSSRNNYWHNLSCHGFSSSRRSLTRILVCRKVKILIAFQYYKTGALESPDPPIFPRIGCMCQINFKQLGQVGALQVIYSQAEVIYWRCYSSLGCVDLQARYICTLISLHIGTRRCQ